MTTATTAEMIESRLVTHLEDAHAMEEGMLRMLDDLIMTTEDEEFVNDFERHRKETERQIRRIEGRLDAHHASRSPVRDLVGIVAALAKIPMDLIRPIPTGRNVRDAYASEHLEIASYEMLERIAELAGDDETAKMARENLKEEQAMAARIEEKWDRATEQSLAEEGVVVLPEWHSELTEKSRTGNGSSGASASRSRSRSTSRGTSRSRSGASRSSAKAGSKS